MKGYDQTETSNENNKEKSQEFVSLSASLRHDAAAVWAHLKPVIDNFTQELRFSDPTSLCYDFLALAVGQTD